MQRTLKTLTALAIAAAAAQAAPAATVQKVAIINGNQAGTSSPGFGCARMVIDTDANTLSYRITYSGLMGAETAAHFHGPAGIGQNAGVLEGLPAGQPKVGVWNYDEADEATILAGNVYINIHSTMFPGGEIRGQLSDMVAVITGDQENPPSGSAGTGYGLFNVDACANTLDYHITFSGLAGSETAAHIHGFALHETNAGVRHGLPAGSPKVGTWNYPQADEEAILSGRTYVNIHSTMFPGGEIRGQITRIVEPVDGNQSGTGKGGSGIGLVALDEGNDQLSFRLSYADLTGPATAAHIHGYAPPGVNAGVVFGIGTANPARDTWTYGAGNEANVLAGLTYFNIHTSAHPGGEIRGQLEFPPPPCPSDTNCDGEVDVQDLVNVILSWDTADPAADVNGDGVVDVSDLVDVVLNWGPCPT